MRGKSIADNLLFRGKAPLDARAQFNSIAEMREFPQEYLPDGFVTYNTETGKFYQFKDNNIPDEFLGKWKELDSKWGYPIAVSKIEGVDYAYEATYSNINYDYAKLRMKQEDSLFGIGKCTSVKKGNYYIRNFDWLYSEGVEFVVHTPHCGQLNETTCLCGPLSKLTKEFVESKQMDDDYIMLPFMAVDGWNEHGLIMNENVVPAEAGNITGVIIPEESVEEELSANMLVRFILDRFNDATTAVNYIKNHIQIYFSKALMDMNYEPHFMISDKNNTYLIEFMNDKTIVTNMTAGSGTNISGKPYMTNFHLTNVVLNEDGSVYTPGTQDANHNAHDTNLISEHGSGLERYNYIALNYDDDAFMNQLDSCVEIAKDLWYTNAYDKANEWYTEFVGGDLTVASEPASFNEIMNTAEEYYNHRSRDPKDKYYGTWQTNHTVIYDNQKMEMVCLFQESDTQIHFAMKSGLNHNDLVNRDLENQHPIGAITGLAETIESIQVGKLEKFDILDGGDASDWTD